MSNKSVIAGLSGKVEVLERRQKHLQEQVDTHQCSQRSVPFIMAEISALTAALEALAWYATERDGSGGVSPLSVIQRLAGIDLEDCDEEDLEEVQAQARELVKGLVE